MIAGCVCYTGGHNFIIIVCNKLFLLLRQKDDLSSHVLWRVYVIF